MAPLRHSNGAPLGLCHSLSLLSLESKDSEHSDSANNEKQSTRSLAIDMTDIS